MAWTDYKQIRLVSMRSQGLSNVAIAEALNEPYNVIAYRVHVSGLGKSKTMVKGAAWTGDRVELLRKLWAEGHSASQIANQLGGTTRNAVIGKINRLGLVGRTPNSRPLSRKKDTPRKSTPQPATKYHPMDLNLKPAVKPAPIAIEKMLNPPRPAETVPLIEIADTQCHYPYRKNGKPVCCGRPVVPGTKWCSDCYGRTHQKDSARPKARQMEAAE